MNQPEKPFILLFILAVMPAVAQGPGAYAQKPFAEPVSTIRLMADASSVEQVSAHSETKTQASDAGADDNGKKPGQSTQPIDRTSTGLSSDRSDELTLGDLRDSGIALNQIRQETINIFLEATRPLCDKTTRSDLIIPNAISEKDLAVSTKISAYQAPRPQWLFYYVGTMEPIISMLSQDVHSAKSGISKMLVPVSTLDKLKPLWQEWTTGIAGINNELTEISKLVDSTQPDNTALAKHALLMYNLTEALEHTRQKAFVIIRDASRRSGATEKVSLP